MSLPVTKTALDRLGHRLSAGDQVVEVDRVMLAQVAGAYQQALDEAEARLGGTWLSSYHASQDDRDSC